MEQDRRNLNHAQITVLNSFYSLPPEERKFLLVTLNREATTLPAEDLSGEAMHAEPASSVATDLHSKPNLLSFKKISDELSPDARMLLLTATQDIAGECCLGWGFKSDRKKLGAPDEVHEIRHAFENVDDLNDTCLIGYWFIWKSGPPGEPMAEVYRQPNRVIRDDQSLIEMLKQVAPMWFKDSPPQEEGDSDGGVRAPVSPPPPDRTPGRQQEMPLPIQATLIGVSPAFAFAQ